jgi:protein Mpv17
MYEQATVTLDHVSIIQFMLFSAITTTPNLIWQHWMEDRWPTTTLSKAEHLRDKPKQGGINNKHVMMKFLLDQSIGSMVNTLLYICVLGHIKGHNLDHILGEVQSVRTKGTCY